MQKIAQQSLVKIVFAGAVAVLLILSIFSYRRIISLIDAFGWVNHTEQVKIELEKISSSLSQAESGQLGFKLTNDSTFLENVHMINQNVNNQLDSILSLTKDNPIQQANSKELRRLVDSRLRYLFLLLNDAAKTTPPS